MKLRDCAALTELVDPNLKYIHSFGGSLLVFLVESSNGPSILKMGLPDCIKLHNPIDLSWWAGGWEEQHAQNEERALRTLEGIAGIPRLYTSYKTYYSPKKSFTAVLKEYIVGKPLTEALAKTNKEIQKRMRDLIVEVGKRKVFVYDVSPRHNLLLRDSQPYIFDFGLAEIGRPDKGNKRLLEDMHQEFLAFRDWFFPDI